MSAIAVISIFICLVGIQISALNLQADESRVEHAEYANENHHQMLGSSYHGSSIAGSVVHGIPYGNAGHGSGNSYGHGIHGGHEHSGHQSVGGGSFGTGSSFGTNPSYGHGYVGASLDKNIAPISKSSMANSHILSSGLAAAAKEKGKVARREKQGASRSAPDIVGSAHLSNYQSYQPPGIYRPSYPSPAPQGNCGNNLLISCRPTYQFVLCSSHPSYEVPSYGGQSYGFY